MKVITATFEILREWQDYLSSQTNRALARKLEYKRCVLPFQNLLAATHGPKQFHKLCKRNKFPDVPQYVWRALPSRNLLQAKIKARSNFQTRPTAIPNADEVTV